MATRSSSSTNTDCGCGCAWIVAGLVFVIGCGIWWFVDTNIHRPPPDIGAHANEYLSTCPSQPDLSVDTSSYSPYIIGKIVVVDKVKGKVADANANSSLNAIRANEPKEVGTIICLYFRTEAVGSYSDGTPATQEFCDIIVFDKTKGVVVGGTTIDGPEPAKAISRATDAYGGDVYEDDIAKYIMSLVRQP